MSGIAVDVTKLQKEPFFNKIEDRVVKKIKVSGDDIVIEPEETNGVYSVSSRTGNPPARKRIDIGDDTKELEITINPEYASSMVIEHDALKKAAIEYFITRAMLSHEVLHAKYSDGTVMADCCKTSPVLGKLLNLLEDARIQAIGSSQSYVDTRLFQFLNTLHRGTLGKITDRSLSDPWSVFEYLFHWFWEKPLPELTPEGNAKWKVVRDLANKALYAETCAEVGEIARKIADTVGLQADNSTTPSQPEFEGKDKPLPSPLAQDQPEESGPIRDSQDSKDEERPPKSKKSKPKKNDDAKKEPTQNGSTDPDGRDSTSDVDRPSDGISEEENAGDDTPDEGDPQESNEQANSPTDASVEQPSSPDTSKKPKRKHVSDELGEQLDDLVGQISESLDDVLDDDLQSLLEAGTGRGNGFYSYQPYRECLNAAAPLIHQLLQELRAEAPRATHGPDALTGKFRTRYYLRNAETPFRRKRFIGRDIPKMAIYMLVDLSGSMLPQMDELRVFATAVYETCRVLKIPLAISLFNGMWEPLKGFDDWSDRYLAALAGARASGGTSIRCGMLHAEMSLQKRPEQLKHLIVLHDGCPSETPTEMQPVIERIRRFGEVFSIYTVAEGTHEHHIQTAQTKLEQIFGAKHFKVCPMRDAARSWCVYIKQRQRVRTGRTSHTLTDLP